jgi:hypothetical protein
MIPSTWAPHRRADDGEVVGYLAPVDEEASASGRYVPMSLLGHPLADPADEWEAVEVLERTGLSMLADQWRYTADGTEIRVRIVSVTPSHVVLKHEDFGDMSHDYGRNFTLALPAGDVLRRA